MTAPREEAHSRLERALVVLNGLTIAISTCRLYPNPLEQTAFARALELVSGGVSGATALRLKVLPDRFSLEGSEFGKSNEAISELAASLFQRGVSELLVRGGPRPSELIGFASLVSADEADIEREGGPDAYLGRRDVSAIKVVDRELQIGEFTPPALQDMPEGVRDLIADQASLAQQLASGLTPPEAYERLRELLRRGMEVRIDLGELSAGVADVVAAMPSDFGAQLVEIALQQLPDEFAHLIVSQLSDGEIAESLTTLSQDRPIDMIMNYAHEVVTHSGGRRPELPVIVGRQLLELGFDSQRVLEAFDSSQKGGAMNPTAFPTETLSLEAAEEELGLAGLREEAKSPIFETELHAGVATMRGLLQSSDREQDFLEILEFIVEAIGKAVADQDRKRYTELIELVVGEASSYPDRERRFRIEARLSKVASAELVADLLRIPGGDSDPTVKRVVDLLGEKTVPALTAQLAEEIDRSRRRTLIEILVAAAPKNPRPIIEGLKDVRWYVVRNMVLILGRIKSVESSSLIEALISHSEPRVRREAVRAAGIAGGVASIPKIVEAISNPDEGTRLAAIVALGSIPHPSSTEALVRFASRRGNRSIRELKEAMTSLILHGDERAMAYLRKTAQRKWPPTSSTRQLSRFAKELLNKAPVTSETS